MVKRLSVLVVSLVLGLVIAACAAPTPTATSTTAPSKAAQPTAAPTKAAAEARPTVPPNQKELNMLGYGGAQEKTMRKAIAGFEKQYGVKVNYTGLSDPQIQAQVLAQKGRPELDLVIANDQSLLIFKREGVAAAFDTRRVTNIAQVSKTLQDKDGIGVPQGLGLIGLTYNAKVFKEKGFAPPSSIFDLWRPELKGHVGVRSVDANITHAWFPLIAKALTGDEKNMDAVFAKFKTLAPNLLTVMTTSAQSDDLLKGGELWLATHNQPRVIPLQDQGVPVEFVIPKEGATAYFNWYIPIKGAPNGELRDELLNYILTPEPQKIIAEELVYPPLVPGVNLDPEKAKRIPSAADLAKIVPSDIKYLNDNVAAWVERWNKEIEVR